MSNKLRLELTKKINNLVENEKLILTEEEIKYMITRWIQGNWDGTVVAGIQFQHYTEPDDPLEREKINGKISLVKVS